jgi:oligopeptide transport system permease protein
MSDPSVLGSAVAEPGASGASGEEALDRARSLASDAWHDLRSRPLFLISVALIAFLLVLAAFPQLFTSAARST